MSSDRRVPDDSDEPHFFRCHLIDKHQGTVMNPIFFLKMCTVIWWTSTRRQWSTPFFYDVTVIWWTSTRRRWWTQFFFKDVYCHLMDKHQATVINPIFFKMCTVNWWTRTRRQGWTPFFFMMCYRHLMDKDQATGMNPIFFKMCTVNWWTSTRWWWGTPLFRGRLSYEGWISEDGDWLHFFLAESSYLRRVVENCPPAKTESDEYCYCMMDKPASIRR